MFTVLVIAGITIGGLKGLTLVNKTQDGIYQENRSTKKQPLQMESQVAVDNSASVKNEENNKPLINTSIKVKADFK